MRPNNSIRSSIKSTSRTRTRSSAMSLLRLNNSSNIVVLLSYIVVVVLLAVVIPSSSTSGGVADASKLDSELSASHPNCPKHCTCDAVKASMRCIHLRGGIPQPPADQKTYFNANSNKTGLTMLIMHRAIFSHAVLSPDNFSHPIYADLVDLAFTMTNLESIQSRTFEALPRLSRLIFKYNQNLKSIEPEAFFGLNLQRLEFHESPQLNMQRDTIFVEARTNKLAITKCGLVDFSYDVFHLLLKISLPMTLLDLEGNALASIDSRFWSLFQNISQINLDGNSLLCVEQNYWLYTLFRKNPQRFITDDSDKKSDLSCSRPKTGEIVYFREANPVDFDIKPATTTLINNNPPLPGSHSNLFYEVQPELLSSSALEGNNNNAGRAGVTARAGEEYDEPIDATIPGERVPSFGRNSGRSSIRNLMVTSPMNLIASTVGGLLMTTASNNNEVDVKSSGLEQTPMSPKQQQDLGGGNNADAFFYILIIAGSVSFVSIIIGVITSVRRATTSSSWPSHNQKSAVVGVSGNNSKGISSKPLQSSPTSSSSTNSRIIANPCVERLLPDGTSNNNNNNINNNKHHHHRHSHPEDPESCSSSADMSHEDCIGESADDSVDNNNNHRCYDNNNNIINNNTSSNGNSHHLYSVINRSATSQNNNNSINRAHKNSNNNNTNLEQQLYSTTDSNTFGTNSINNTNRYQHHSSNSTSPLLSASPQGSSHSSSTRSAVLLGPLPPPLSVTTKVIRFADIESDEC